MAEETPAPAYERVDRKVELIGRNQFRGGRR